MTTAVVGQRTAGVIGGMGPQATLDFLSKVLGASAAQSDQDHIRMLVDIDPRVPDRNVAIAAGSDAPGRALASMAVALERAGADFLVMPCNTAHAFEPAIRSATTLPFVSLIAETVAAVRRAWPQAECVGVLATSGCRAAGLYERALARAGRKIVVADTVELQSFMRLLYQIKAAAGAMHVRVGMRQLAESLVRRGAEVIVAGCTEVPLVLAAEDVPVPLVDSTAVLAERTIAYARGAAPLPPPERLEAY